MENRQSEVWLANGRVFCVSHIETNADPNLLRGFIVVNVAERAECKCNHARIFSVCKMVVYASHR